MNGSPVDTLQDTAVDCQQERDEAAPFSAPTPARLTLATPAKASIQARWADAPPPASRSAPHVIGRFRAPANPKNEYTATAVPRAAGGDASMSPAVSAAESAMIART